MSILVQSSIISRSTAYPVALEISTQKGAGYIIVRGLPEDVAAANEQRVHRAITASGFQVPQDTTVTATFHPDLSGRALKQGVQFPTLANVSSTDTVTPPASVTRITIH